MKRDLRTIIHRSGLVAGVAAVGLSIASCSSGSNDAAAAASTTGGAGQPGQGGPAVFSRGVSGEVIDVDGSTITVEQVAQDGTITEAIVETSDDTTVTEMVAATLDDLALGDEVVAAGGTDGSAATTISEGGALFGGGPGGGQPPFGSGPPPDGSATPPDGSTPPPDFATDGADSQGVPSGPGGPGRGIPGGMATFGTISEIGDGTITIETADGESVVVTVDETTTVTLSQDREVSDIAEGDMIRVQSPPTDDSAVVAGNIVIQTDS